jgi:hypothetical protein
MHDYAIFGHDRTTIGRWLGVSSILIAGGISQLLAWANSVTGWEAFTKATVTTGVIYFVIHWLFNKYGWKIPFFSIPNLNGTWKIEGITLDQSGNSKFNWEGELGITQDWKSILIHLKTKNSQSNSYTATLSKRAESCGGWLLSYSYRNQPELEQSHELNAHKGFCEIEIDKTLKIGKAAYFNSNGRRTFGVMTLNKELV